MQLKLQNLHYSSLLGRKTHSLLLLRMVQTLTTFRGKSPSWNNPHTTLTRNWPIPDQPILLKVVSSFTHFHCSLSHCPFLDIVISLFALDNVHQTLELYYEALLGTGHDRHIRESQNSLDSALLSLQLRAVEETAQNSYPDLLSKLPDDHHSLYHNEIVCSGAKVSKVVHRGWCRKTDEEPHH